MFEFPSVLRHCWCGRRENQPDDLARKRPDRIIPNVLCCGEAPRMV